MITRTRVFTGATAMFLSAVGLLSYPFQREVEGQIVSLETTRLLEERRSADCYNNGIESCFVYSAQIELIDHLGESLTVTFRTTFDEQMMSDIFNGAEEASITYSESLYSRIVNPTNHIEEPTRVLPQF